MSGGLLAIDLGTTKCKVILFDLGGNVLRKEVYRYGTIILNENQIEQKPEEWWEVVIKALRRISRSYNDIIGIGVTGQAHGVIPVDKKGRVLRNAIIWMDQRSSKLMREIHLRKGVKISPYTYLAKLIWIRMCEPDTYLKAWKFLHPIDFIVYKLSGEAKTDFTNVLRIYDPSRRAYKEELLEELGISINKLPEIVAPGEVIGTIRDDLADELGISRDAVIISGGIDSLAAALGAGCIKEGMACDVAGTSSVLLAYTRQKIIDKLGRVITSPFYIPSSWMLVGLMSSTGAALEWFKKLFLPESSLERIDALAMNSPPGSDGIIFLPYLVGERSPIWNPRAKAVFFGLRMKHGISSLTRAVLEGVAFALRHNLEVMEELGLKIDEIRTVGGCSNSRIWCQIKSDICDKKFTTLKVKDGANMGVAILLSVAIGVYKDLVEAVQKLIKTEEIFLPREENRTIYDRAFTRYKAIYNRLENLF